MTVATEVSYAERTWTGVETSFAPGMSAQDASHITVKYRDVNDVVTALTIGVHVIVSKAGDPGDTGAISATPLTMPPAPGVVIFERRTPALQPTDFVNLEDFDPVIHTRRHDAAALWAAELRNRQDRAITPYTVSDVLVDFRGRRLAADDPVNSYDVATKSYVLQVTGVLSLQAYVDQAAASALAAAASNTGAQTAKAGSEAARDLAQLWAEQPEDTPVTTGPNKYSAHHWANKANAAAAIVLPYLTQTDDGLFGTADAGSQDDGAF
jgi:hypothetical protein